jgi:hypothetical protein
VVRASGIDPLNNLKTFLSNTYWTGNSDDNDLVKMLCRNITTNELISDEPSKFDTEKPLAYYEARCGRDYIDRMKV